MADSTIAEAVTGEKRLAGWILTIAAAGLITWLTLVRTPGGLPALGGGELLLTDVVLNILLFVPFGIGLGLLGRGVSTAALIGIASSACIEACQIVWIPGRDASLHDIVTNGVGTAVGALLVHGWSSRSRWWRRVGPLLSLLAGTAWLAGSTLIRTVVPPVGPWYGQWAHELGGAVRFPGRVLSFTVNGEDIPDDLIPGSGPFRDRLARSDTIRAELRIITAAPFDGRAQLAGIVSPGGDEIMSLWQEGDALLARPRLRMTDAALRAPWLILPHAFPVTAGDTLRVSLTATRGAIVLAVGDAGFARHERITLAPELFWAAFVPFDYAVGGGLPAWPLLATALVFLVIGLGAVRRPAVCAGVAIAILLLAPLVTGTPHPGWITSLLALLSASAGLVLGRRLGLLAA